MNTESLWKQVLYQKYIGPGSVEEQIQSPMELHVGSSIFWKEVVKYVDVIENSLSWLVRYGRKLRFGEGPWVRSIQQHRLHDDMMEKLRLRGIIFLSQLVAPCR